MSYLLSVFFVIVLFSSCENPIEDIEEGYETTTFTVPAATSIDEEVIRNPYELTHMEETLYEINELIYGSILKSNKGTTSKFDFSDFQIVANYRYIKFSPATHEQENLLLLNEDLVLVDYPLSYQDADHYYITTGLPMPAEDDILEYYTSVPLNMSLPAVPFTEIELMYLPDEDPYFDNIVDDGQPTVDGKINSKEDLMNHIITYAYRNSSNGNLIPPDQIETSSDGTESKFLGISFRSKWRPTGSIKIWDENFISTTEITETRLVGYRDVNCDLYGFNEPIAYLEDDNGDIYGESVTSNAMQLERDTYTCRVPIYETVVIGTQTNVGAYVPLKGAQILIRDTYTISNEITDSNGNFRFREVRPSVRNLIQWERHNYSIRDGGWQASLKGPKMRNKSWHKKIRDGEDAYHANIHRGAHMYYYDNLPGLTKPPTPFGPFNQMKIAAVESDGASNHVPFRSQISFNLLSRIRIKEWRESTEQVIGTTIHELAHAVHHKIDEGAYVNLVHDAYIPPFSANGERDDNRRLMESYATHIEITYMDEFYDRLGLPLYQYIRSNLQEQRILDDIHYTTLIYDLTDDFNQGVIFGTNRLNGRPVDNVENFTLKDVEDALIDATDLDDYRRNLEALGKDNAADIRELFANWEL